MLGTRNCVELDVKVGVQKIHKWGQKIDNTGKGSCLFKSFFNCVGLFVGDETIINLRKFLFKNLSQFCGHPYMEATIIDNYVRLYDLNTNQSINELTAIGDAGKRTKQEIELKQKNEKEIIEREKIIQEFGDKIKELLEQKIQPKFDVINLLTCWGGDLDIWLLNEKLGIISNVNKGIKEDQLNINHGSGHFEGIYATSSTDIFIKLYAFMTRDDRIKNGMKFFPSLYSNENINMTVNRNNGISGYYKIIKDNNNNDLYVFEFDGFPIKNVVYFKEKNGKDDFLQIDIESHLYTYNDTVSKWGRGFDGDSVKFTIEQRKIYNKLPQTKKMTFMQEIIKENKKKAADKEKKEKEKEDIKVKEEEELKEIQDIKEKFKFKYKENQPVPNVMLNLLYDKIKDKSYDKIDIKVIKLELAGNLLLNYINRHLKKFLNRIYNKRIRGKIQKAINYIKKNEYLQPASFYEIYSEIKPDALEKDINQMQKEDELKEKGLDGEKEKLIFVKLLTLLRNVGSLEVFKDDPEINGYFNAGSSVMKYILNDLKNDTEGKYKDIETITINNFKIIYSGREKDKINEIKNANVYIFEKNANENKNKNEKIEKMIKKRNWENQYPIGNVFFALWESLFNGENVIFNEEEGIEAGILLKNGKFSEMSNDLLSNVLKSLIYKGIKNQNGIFGPDDWALYLTHIQKGKFTQQNFYEAFKSIPTDKAKEIFVEIEGVGENSEIIKATNKEVKNKRNEKIIQNRDWDDSEIVGDWVYNLWVMAYGKNFIIDKAAFKKLGVLTENGDFNNEFLVIIKKIIGKLVSKNIGVNAGINKEDYNRDLKSINQGNFTPENFYNLFVNVPTDKAKEIIVEIEGTGKKKSNQVKEKTKVDEEVKENTKVDKEVDKEVKKKTKVDTKVDKEVKDNTKADKEVKENTKVDKEDISLNQIKQTLNEIKKEDTIQQTQQKQDNINLTNNSNIDTSISKDEKLNVENAFEIVEQLDKQDKENVNKNDRQKFIDNQIEEIGQAIRKIVQDDPNFQKGTEQDNITLVNNSNIDISISRKENVKVGKALKKVDTLASSNTLKRKATKKSDVKISEASPAFINIFNNLQEVENKRQELVQAKKNNKPKQAKISKSSKRNEEDIQSNEKENRVQLFKEYKINRPFRENRDTKVLIDNLYKSLKFN